jgi:hypothetical protein
MDTETTKHPEHMRTEKVQIEVGDRFANAEEDVYKPGARFDTDRQLLTAVARIHYDNRHPDYLNLLDYYRENISREGSRREFHGWILSRAVDNARPPVDVSAVVIYGHGPMPETDKAFILHLPNFNETHAL